MIGAKELQVCRWNKRARPWPANHARWTTLIAICALAVGTGANCHAAPTLRSLGTDDILSRALYSHPGRMVSRISGSGAVGENARWERGEISRWFVEQQRHGGDLIQAGVVRGDESLINQGMKLLDWGFAHQGADGSFPGTGDPFHSTSMFLEGAARGALLLDDYDSSRYHDAIERYRNGAHAAARWLMEPRVSERGRHNNEPYLHRRWLLAAALGETAKLTGDKGIGRAAEDYAREAISEQEADGAFPEKGGFDVNYQAFGMLLASRYYAVCPDSSVRGAVRDSIERGLKREMANVEPNGTVLVGESTRTGYERGHNNQVKSIDYKIIAQALVAGAKVTGDSGLRSAAQSILTEHAWLHA